MPGEVSYAVSIASQDDAWYGPRHWNGTEWTLLPVRPWDIWHWDGMALHTITIAPHADDLADGANDYGGMDLVPLSGGRLGLVSARTNGGARSVVTNIWDGTTLGGREEIETINEDCADFSDEACISVEWGGVLSDGSFVITDGGRSLSRIRAASSPTNARDDGRWERRKRITALDLDLIPRGVDTVSLTFCLLLPPSRTQRRRDPGHGTRSRASHALRRTVAL